MNAIQEYGLLIAAATPVLVILGLQVFLFVCGERDTLLLPALGRFPRMDAAATIDEALAPAAGLVVVRGEAIAHEESVAEAA
jgi:hypothetical protein